MCYRRATSVLKNHPEEHRALCLMADSEGPAECAAAGKYHPWVGRVVALSDVFMVGCVLGVLYYSSSLSCR